MQARLKSLRKTSERRSRVWEVGKIGKANHMIYHNSRVIH